MSIEKDKKREIQKMKQKIWDKVNNETLKKIINYLYEMEKCNDR